MGFFRLWCALFYSTRAQQASSDPTPTSNSASIPWITYTSTRSCTSRPSTVLVYTSNSSSFLLTHYGPSSASTPVEYTSIPTVSDRHEPVASGSSLAIASSRSFDGTSATSQPPFSAIPGSTCPLPSTATVSAPPFSNLCDSTAEKTVTSYIMTSCAVRNDSIIASSLGVTAEQFATSRNTTDPELQTSTTLGDDPNNATLAPIDSTLSKDDSANLCTSVMERTITVERTVSAPELEPVYITLTTLQGSSTIYQTSLSERTAGASRPANSISTSYTNGSVISRTSELQATSGRDIVIYTTYKEASTVFSVTTIRQTPSPITITSTKLQAGTTLYSISTVGRTAIPITLTLTQLLGANASPRTTKNFGAAAMARWLLIEDFGR
jgi:hypothetical protein